MGRYFDPELRQFTDESGVYAIDQAGREIFIPDTEAWRLEPDAQTEPTIIIDINSTRDYALGMEGDA